METSDSIIVTLQKLTPPMAEQNIGRNLFNRSKGRSVIEYPHDVEIGGLMKHQPCLLIMSFLFIVFLPRILSAEGGITPEQIYQPGIDWNKLIGTWEVLPDSHPLDEKIKNNRRPTDRMLMTLRKDGTCRLFNKEYPLGTDCVWKSEDHQMLITFPNGGKLDLFVYGIKGDFMMALSPIKNGKDLLWSRVK